MPLLAFLVANKDSIGKPIRPDDVKKYLPENGAFNEITENYETPILLAMAMGNFALVDFLEKSGASLALPKEYVGPSLLELALSYVMRGLGLDTYDLFERLDFVQRLIEKTDDVNGKNKDGNTPVIQLLLHRPLYANANNRALAEGRAKLLKSLIVKGADINIKSFKNQSALSIALSHAYDYSEVTKALLESQRLNPSSLNTVDGDGWHPLFRAVAHREMMIVLMLIRQGSDIQFKDKQQNSVLHICAKNPDAQILEILLSHSLDVNQLNADSLSPLHILASMGDNDCISLLFKQGANFNIKNKEGQTPLLTMLLGKEPKIDTVKLLLLKGADPNLADIHGVSPMNLVKDNTHYHAVIRYSVENFDKLEEKKPVKILDPLPKSKRPSKIIDDIEPELDLELEIEADIDIELPDDIELDLNLDGVEDLANVEIDEEEISETDMQPFAEIDEETTESSHVKVKSSAKVMSVTKTKDTAKSKKEKISAKDIKEDKKAVQTKETSKKAISKEKAKSEPKVKATKEKAAKAVVEKPKIQKAKKVIKKPKVVKPKVKAKPKSEVIKKKVSKKPAAKKAALKTAGKKTKSA